MAFVCGNVSWGRQNLDTYQYTYMCVYYGSINKTINVKTVWITPGTLNIVQSLSFFWNTLLFLTWVHEIMCTSTLRVKERWSTLWASVMRTANKVEISNRQANAPMGLSPCLEVSVGVKKKKNPERKKGCPLVCWSNTCRRKRQNLQGSPLRGLCLDNEHIHTTECIYVDVVKKHSCPNI